MDAVSIDGSLPYASSGAAAAVGAHRQASAAPSAARTLNSLIDGSPERTAFESAAGEARAQAAAPRQFSSDFFGGSGGRGATGTPSSSSSRTSLGVAWP